MWKIALEPIAETITDLHSYGGRSYRSVEDAMGFLVLMIGRRTGPKWVLKADIDKFFDEIQHDWVLDNIPINKSVLKQFLKAGYTKYDNPKILSTDASVPQGGSISSLIATMALNGLEDFVKQKVTSFDRKQKKIPGGKGATTKQWTTQTQVVRYVDDVLITCASKKILEEVIKPELSSFLAERGLQLNQSKTEIVHIKKGFDFLGFRMQLIRRK